MTCHSTDRSTARDEPTAFEDVYDAAAWDAPGSLNIAHETCDRHAAGGEGVALHHVDPSGDSTRLGFDELADRSNRFANLLEGLTAPGDRVFAYMPRRPEQYVAMLGTLKRGAVWGSVSEAYDTDGLATRVEDAEPSVIVTTRTNREVVADAVDDRSVETVVVSDDGTGVRSDDLDYHGALAREPASYETAATSGDDDALLYYTSGTTGEPKGVRHEHSWIAGAALGQRNTADIGADDFYWSTADLGWLTGALNTLGAWFWGATVFAYEEDPSPETCATLLDEHPITVLTSVPPVYRALHANDGVLDGVETDLRHAVSLGEPLSADLIEWGRDRLGVPVHDAYKQTETGTTIVSNTPGAEIKPGSMGRPMPGVDVAVVDPDSGEPMGPGETGVVAQRPGTPSLFAGYWERPGRTAESYVEGPDGEWYLTGDLASRDDEGYFWYEGRVDDVIRTAEGLVGTFPVESTLEAHDAVFEAAAVPADGDGPGAVVEAYVVPSAGVETGRTLQRELREWCSDRIAVEAVPRCIEFVEEFPKTVSNKVRRTELRSAVDDGTHSAVEAPADD